MGCYDLHCGSSAHVFFEPLKPRTLWIGTASGVNSLGRRLVAASDFRLRHGRTLSEGEITCNTLMGRAFVSIGVAETTHPTDSTQNGTLLKVSRRRHVQRHSHGPVRHAKFIVKVFQVVFHGVARNACARSDLQIGPTIGKRGEQFPLPCR